MNSCTVRVLGPSLAKAMLPRVFECRTASSGMRRDCHTELIDGSPEIPNCATKFSITRKKYVLS